MKPDPGFHIPQDLPPHTALALFELRSEFTDALWQHYETELVELTRDELNHLPDAQQAFDFNDELPFWSHFRLRLACGGISHCPAWDVAFRLLSERSCQISWLSTRRNRGDEDGEF